MPRVAANYSLPTSTWYPAVDDTEMVPEDSNDTLADIATALTGSVPFSGAGSMAGNLNLGSHKVVSLANGIASSDAAAIGQIQPIDATLTAIGALTFDATNAYLRATGSDTFVAESATAHKTALSLNNVDNTSDATKNAAAVTLTNKTLTTPTINGATFTGTVTAGGAWTWSSAATFSSGVKVSGGTAAAGTIVSASNFGMLFASNAPTPGIDQFAFYDSTVSTRYFGVTAAGVLTTNARPVFNGNTPYDSGNLPGTAITWTANQAISLANPLLTLNDTSSTGAATLKYQSNGTNKWLVGKGAFNGGQNFEWYNYGLGAIAFQIADTTGIVTVTGELTANSITAAPTVSTETTGTLTTASRNKQINASGGITIPASVFAADNLMIIYAGASARTLTQGAGGTQRLHGSATTGNLTLAARGVAGIKFISATEWVVTGDVS